MPRRKKYVIHDTTPPDDLFDPVVAGERKGRGFDPSFIDSGIRGEMKALPSEIKIIPHSEWDARIDEQEEQKSSLEHIRATMADGKKHVSLDQNGQGFCWAYSTGQSLIYARGAAHMPYRRFSPHAVACKIKGFRDEGGWCGLSMKFAKETGYPTENEWPQKSMSRQYDNAETWKIAADYKVTEDFVDLTQQVYDQNLTFDQVATCLLNNIPVVVDFNWWSHSVLAIRLIRIERGSFGLRIQNSWSDGWGNDGLGDLQGTRSIPNGAVATRVVGRAA
jgi:hypothetical protein